MKKEIIFDKILKKFEGNKTFSWDDIQKKEFYLDVDSDYFVVENHLNFLIGEDLLKEQLPESVISLSRKGWFVMTNSKTEGYSARKKKENKKKCWTITLGIVSIATFILVVIRFSNDFVFTAKSKKTDQNATVMSPTSNDTTHNQQDKPDTNKNAENPK